MLENKGQIIVISGPSGAGKNTVYDGLTALMHDVVQTVSVTTRKPRDGEVDGVDYYFVSKNEFLEKINAEEFVEYVQYGENYYGTLKSEIHRLADSGRKVVLVIEVNGAFNIKREFPEAKTIFIIPPSIEVLRERISCRGQNNADDTEIRLKIAVEELKYKDKYDYCVVNDDLNACVDEVYRIINK